jgi:oxygen-independent coproporphyrinogen-3 oxidase
VNGWKGVSNMDLDLTEIIGNNRQGSIGFQPLVETKKIEWNDHVFEQNICLYIHIPFCKQKCSFCGLFSTVGYSTEKLHDYTEAVIREIKLYSQKVLVNKKVKGIHFGGGTPSLLDIEDLKRIIDTINEYCDTSILKEILVESNPSSLSEEKISQYEKIDKLKLNMGVQSFDPECLIAVRRNMNPENIDHVISYALNSKINGVGIDLICGLPNSSLDSCINDIKHAVQLGVDYVTLYPLWIEKNTILEKQNTTNHDVGVKYNGRKEMLIQMSNILLKHGYQRLSVYHWAKIGLPNFVYSQSQMEGESWIGIGAGAASYIDGLSLNNTYNINQYIKESFQENYSIDSVQRFNLGDQLLRNIAFGLRLIPLDMSVLVTKYGKYLVHSIYKKLESLGKSGLLVIEDDKIHLTYDGILNLDYIEEFVMEDY